MSILIIIILYTFIDFINPSLPDQIAYRIDVKRAICPKWYGKYNRLSQYPKLLINEKRSW